jgi:hypothetical protein
MIAAQYCPQEYSGISKSETDARFVRISGRCWIKNKSVWFDLRILAFFGLSIFHSYVFFKKIQTVTTSSSQTMCRSVSSVYKCSRQKKSWGFSHGLWECFKVEFHKLEKCAGFLRILGFWRFFRLSKLLWSSEVLLKACEVGNSKFSNCKDSSSFKNEKEKKICKTILKKRFSYYMSFCSSKLVLVF